MQWLQDLNQRNVDNLYNARREASRYFSKKKKNLKAKINESETNSKRKNVREMYSSISYVRKGYELRTTIERTRR